MNRLKEFRARAGIKQEDLAELSGLSRASVRSYEQGRALPTIRSVQKLVRGFAKAGVYVTSDEIYPME